MLSPWRRAILDSADLNVFWFGDYGGWLEWSITPKNKKFERKSYALRYMPGTGAWTGTLVEACAEDRFDDLVVTGEINLSNSMTSYLASLLPANERARAFARRIND